MSVLAPFIEIFAERDKHKELIKMIIGHTNMLMRLSYASKVIFKKK